MQAGPKSIGIWALPLAVLLLTAGVFALDLGGVASSLSGQQFDAYQRIQPRAQEDIVGRTGFSVRALDIDNAATARFGKWPWPSGTLQKITGALRHDGASIVVYAFALDANDPASPQRFAAQLPPGNEAARNALNKMISTDESLAVVMKGVKAVTGFTLENIAGDTVAPAKSHISVSGAADPFSRVPNYRFAARALPLFETASAGSGALNFLPDRDGVLRNVPLVLMLNGSAVPSLDAEVLSLAAGKPSLTVFGVKPGIPLFGGAAYIANVFASHFTINTRADGAITLYFSANDEEKVLHVSDLFAAHPPSLKNMIVIIGPPGKTLRTPVGLRSVADIHAEALRNMLLDQALSQTATRLPQTVFLLVMGCALIMLLARAKLFWSGVFTLAAIALAQIFGWFMFSNAHLLIYSGVPCVALALAWVTGFCVHATAVSRSRTALHKSFAAVLPAPVIEKIARDPSKLRLDGETRIVTCLSCGLRGYAELSQAFKDDPIDFTRMITTAMAPLIEAALDHGGTIGYLGGDSFMAYWNAPVDDGEHAIHACDAAQHMTLALASVNEQLSHERRFDGTAFAAMEIGIGISTGPAIAGGFTARGHTTYVVTGDCTILAVAIRELSGQYGPAIVVSEDTRKAAERGYAFLEVDFIAAGARDDAVKLFAILGNPVLRASPKFRALATFQEHIFQSIRTQQWQKARSLIEQARKLSGASQKLYDLHLSRIGEFEKNPPGSDWDGAFRPTLK